MSVSAFILQRHAYAAAARQRQAECEDRRRLHFLEKLLAAPIPLRDPEHAFATRIQRREAVLRAPTSPPCLNRSEQLQIDGLRRKYGLRLDAAAPPQLHRSTPAAALPTRN